MTRTRLRLVFCLALLGAAVGFAGRASTAVFAPATAQAAGPAVTPKTEAPNEARALSHAFSNVAKALGAVGRAHRGRDRRRARRHGPHARRRMPDDGDDGDDDEVPPFFRHFFQFGPGGGGMPAPGPAARRRARASSSTPTATS